MSAADRRRPVMAIIGDGGAIDDERRATAEALGLLAIEAGLRVATGGLGGVMAAASEGARRSPSWRCGDILGILPGYDRGTANPFVDIPIATGMQYGRNVILVATSDVVVAVGGGSGTLSEIALGWQLGKPIIAVEPSGGWAARIAGQALDARNDTIVHAVSSPVAAVQLALTLLETAGTEPGFVGEGWRRRGS